MVSLHRLIDGLLALIVPQIPILAKGGGVMSLHMILYKKNEGHIVFICESRIAKRFVYSEPLSTIFEETNLNNLLCYL